MVSEIRIYYEGDKRLRPGLLSFLESEISIARQRSIRFQLITGGSANITIERFIQGVEANPDAFNILLVDSDRPDNGTLIESIKARSTWDTRIGANVQDDQIHFMVQIMESWFLADKDALARYYGRDFRSNRLPQNPNVEHVPKDDVIRGLTDAASDTSQRTYHKTKHAPALLREIDPTKVRNAAPNCDRLFNTLRREIGGT